MSTNLSMKRGDNKIVQVTLGNLTANGITDFQFWFTAKQSLGDTDAQAVIKKLPADFNVVQAGNASTPGIVTCEILPADTSSLGDFIVNLTYDVQVKDASGRTTTIQDGKLKVKPDVTRATV